MENAAQSFEELSNEGKVLFICWASRGSLAYSLSFTAQDEWREVTGLDFKDLRPVMQEVLGFLYHCQTVANLAQHNRRARDRQANTKGKL